MNQTERKRQAVLDVTFRLLNDKPIKAITIDEIAHDAGVSKVTVFKYFTSKNHLMNVVITHAFDAMLRRIKEILDGDMGFVETYRAITSLKMDQVKRYTAVFQENMMTQYSTSPDFFDADALTIQNELYRHLMAKGRAEGYISSQVTDADMQLILHVFTEGMKGVEASRLLESADFLTRFFLNGLQMGDGR